MTVNRSINKYDDLGRLTEVVYPYGGSAEYQHDTEGNRTQVTHAVPTPTPAPSGLSVQALPNVSQGDFENAAMMVLLNNGKLVGWGDSATGMNACGNKAAVSARIQNPVFNPNTTVPPNDAYIVDWAITNANLYVVYSNGWLYSAGSNAYGQLLLGDTVARPYLTQVSLGSGWSCKRVWAAGSGSLTDAAGLVYYLVQDATGSYQLRCGGASPPDPVFSYPPGVNGDEIRDIKMSAVGASFSVYMLRSDGKVMAGGANAQGQLGSGTTSTGFFSLAYISGYYPSGTPLSNVVEIAVTAGASGGSFLALDSSGNVWSTGYNASGQLGLGNTAAQMNMTQVLGLSNIIKIGIGGGSNAYCYAIEASGRLFTWGYNTQNNLFQNSTANVLSPKVAQALPETVDRIFFPKSDALSTNAQMLALTTSGILTFCGSTVGLLGLDNNVVPGAYKTIPMPRGLRDGTERIKDVFYHGTGTSQRLFALSDAGNLYSCGANVSSICTGGISSNSMPASLQWHKIALRNRLA
jgi:alpha-tubulin suppressor-like RCC1 family protein